MRNEYDLIVIGGGPGGSTLGGLVARQGHRVLLLERDRFPRYQIGESLLPATINGICPLLGLSEKVKQAGYVKKHGGTFRWGREEQFWTLNFGFCDQVGDPSDGHRVSAYQVKRAHFDHMLLTQAAELGVETHQGCRVQALLMDGERTNGVKFVDGDGIERTARARFVADVSGNQSQISSHCGERVYSKFYRNIALYGYFLGGERIPAPDEGNVFFEAFEGGWIWYIPLSAELTSVGVLVSPERSECLKGDHAAALRGFIDECPVIKKYLAKAVRATEAPYDQIRIRKDFSYAHSQFWKPGFVSVGDCACFVDVLLSSGVHLSTYAALLAARSINTLLRGGLNEALCFDEFEIRYRMEFGKFYQLLIGLYDMRRDSKTYHMWLRYWIRSTNAFSLEPPDLGMEPTPVSATEDEKSLSVEIAKKQRDLIGYLRQLNRKLLETQEGPLTMEQVPKIPFSQGTLQIAADRLHWELPKAR